jgi:hypothetical protein
MLENEYAVYDSHRAEFLRDHKDEFVVIKGELIIGFFKTEHEALEHMKEEQLGTFLVQRCVTIDNETAHYASRVVAFA